MTSFTITTGQQEGDTFGVWGTFWDGTGDWHEVGANWGDGQDWQLLSVDEEEQTFSGSHLYPQNGSYSGMVSIRDNWADTAWPFGISVSEADPVIDQVTGNISANETELLTIQTTLHDAGIWDGHNIHILWGDGQESWFVANLLGENTASLSAYHGYADSGEYTISITAVDIENGASSDSISFGVSIHNVAPTASVSADGTITESQFYPLSLEDATDVSGPDALALRYSFAHEQAELIGEYDDASGTSFALMDFDGVSGTHQVWARVLDKDGGHNDYSAQVTVLSSCIAPSADARCTLTGVGGSNPMLSLTTGTLTFTADVGSIYPGLSLNVGSGTTVRFKARQHLKDLSIAGGGQVILTSLPNSPLVVKSLAIAADGKLDLRNNALILDYDGSSPDLVEQTGPNVSEALAACQGLASPEEFAVLQAELEAYVPQADVLAEGDPGATLLAEVRAYILRGQAYDWTRDGITSSWAATFPGTALSLDQSAVMSPAGGVFAGEPVDKSAIVVSYALPADSNLDDHVNFDDLLAMAQHYGRTSGATWSTADFNYDGHVNFDDLLAMAQHYGATLSRAPTVSITGLPTSPPGLGVPITLGHTTAVDPGTTGDFSYDWTCTNGTNTWTDTGALTFIPNANASYVVSLAVSDGDGVVCRATATIAVGVPAAPTWLSTTVNANTLTLQWAPQSDATEFVVEYSVDRGNWQQLGTATGSATSLSHYVQRRYYYRAWASNTLGNSAYSAVVCPAFAPEDKIVEVSAVVQSSPTPSITLSWPAKTGTDVYSIYRKLRGDTSWGSAIAGGYGKTFTDTNVTVGCAFEYRVSVGLASGYVYSGIEAPLIEHRGTVLLIMTPLVADNLGPEVERLKQDMIGDGWTVVTPADPSETTASVATVKQFILDSYSADVKSVFLLGHVPIPLTPSINPDGHNPRSFLADCYYGDLDEDLWDIGTNGVFTNTSIPADADSEPIELAVGRVDLSKMQGAFKVGEETDEQTETRLLKQYLDKDHDFRTHVTTVQNRGFIEDGWGNGYTFASGAWKDFSAFFGSDPVDGSMRIDTPAPSALPVDVKESRWLPYVQNTSYLWGYAGGGGFDPTRANYIYSSAEFVPVQSKVVFTSFFGSYLGQWDQPGSLLQAPLANSGYGLTNAWIWDRTSFYEMGLGQTIGESIRRCQCGLFFGSDFLVTSLLGDPTLRMHVVAPVGSASKATGIDSVSLTWTASADEALGTGAFLGYDLYRAQSAGGAFTKLNTSYITGTSFSDSEGTSSSVYMVKAIKVEGTGVTTDEISGSGTYINSSQGVIAVEEP